jgi:hypothetical protein
MVELMTDRLHWQWRCVTLRAAGRIGNLSRQEADVV